MQVDDVRMAGKGRGVIRLAFWLAASLVSLSPVWQPVRAAEGDASTPFQVAAINPAMPAPLARTRFVIQLERAVEFQVSALADPNRVIVELPDVKMLLPAQMDEKATGLVKSFRGGLSAPGRSRIVIDVAAPVVVERAALDKDGKMHRLVLEIAPGEPSDPKPAPQIQLSRLGAGQLQPPTPRRAQPPAG